MKNKKIEKNLVKIGVGAAVSLVLGIVYKLGQRLDDDIDKKYEKEHGVKPGGLFK